VINKEMMEQKKNIFFFDWYENSQIRHFGEFFKPDPKKEKEIQSDDDKIAMIKRVSKDWKTTSGKQVEYIHPPFEPIQLEVNTKGESVKACPLKNISRTTYSEPLKVEHIGHLVEQQNFSNISLHVIGQQTDRIEAILMDGANPNKSEVKVNIPSSSQSDLPNTQIVVPPFVPQMAYSKIKLGKQKPMGSSISKDLISELSNKLGSLKVNKNVNQITEEEREDVISKIRSFKTTTQIAMTRNYYPRPTYADLQFEELPHIANMACFNGKEIVEWNLDGFVEYQIFTMCHQMIMYANAYIANGNKEKEAAQIIIIGFSRQLRGWWDHYPDQTQRQTIIEAVKIDSNGKPIILTNQQGQSLGSVSDAISTLLYNIVYHFTRNYQDIYEKNGEQLINLRCKTMSDFRWYKDSFLSKLYTLPDPNQDFLERKVYIWPISLVC
jgi:hypothetical protein